MPNQLAATNRRVNYIESKSRYEFLERKAKRERVSVGELIRLAIYDYLARETGDIRWLAEAKLGAQRKRRARKQPRSPRQPSLGEEGMQTPLGEAQVEQPSPVVIQQTTLPVSGMSKNESIAVLEVNVVPAGQTDCRVVVEIRGSSAQTDASTEGKISSPSQAAVQLALTVRSR